jgi:hypothetical protein
MLRQLTQDEVQWQESQPVRGTPSLARLRSALSSVGLPPVEVGLDAEAENVHFHLIRARAVRSLDADQTTRLLISTFRSSGFDVGFTELGVTDLFERSLSGTSLVGPLHQVCERRAPTVET